MSAWRLLVAVGLLYVTWLSHAPTVDAATLITSDITSDSVWTASSSPYVIKSAINVASGVTLTIEPGVAVKFDTSGVFSVSGQLLVEGTESEPIYITSIKDDEAGGDTNGDGSNTSPQARDWRTIQFNSGSIGRFNFATIRYAGYFNSSQRSLPAIYNNGGSVNVENSVVSDNRAYGIGQVAGSLEIRNSDISNQNYGIVVISGDTIIYGSEFSQHDYKAIYSIGNGILDLRNNNFIDNAISADVDLSLERDFIHSGNRASGSGLNGIVLRGSIVGNTTLSSGDMPYIVTSIGGLSAIGAINITTESNLRISASGQIAIEPGVVIKFFNDASMIVDGKLDSVGTKEDPIYFTSIKDDEVGGDTNDDGGASLPGSSNWLRIQFNSGSVGNFDNSIIRYSGARAGNDLIQSGIYNNGGDVTIINSELSYNNQNGFLNNNGTASITKSSISGHVVFGVWNKTSAELNASNNYWGDGTGPYHPVLNPGGLGDSVSNNVFFNPWFTTYPPEEPPEPPEIDPLILQYEPVLYFHPDEDYYPMNVEAFVEGSGLWDSSFIDEVIIPRGENNGLDLNYLANGTDTENWYIAFSSDEAGEFNLTDAKTRYDNLVTTGKAVPTYYAYKMEDGYTDDFGNDHEFIVLQYWYFYAMNNWGASQPFGNTHEGDWESVFIFLNKDTEEPLYIAYSSHHNDGDPAFNLLQYDSVRRAWEEIEKDLNHPISYVAVGSHALYADLGLQGNHKVTNLSTDVTSSEGERLYSDDWYSRQILSADTPSWQNQYKGLFGTDKFGIGTAGTQGPFFTDVSGIVRFVEPVKWAGLDKVNDTTIQVASQVFDLDAQGVLLEFTEALEVGTKLTTSLYDEFISFGSNLTDISLLPHFWDFESDLENGTFNAKVTFEYNQTELANLSVIENDLTVYYYNEVTNSWEAQPSFLDMHANTIYFMADHFSRYAIGAPKWDTLTTGFEIKKRWGKYDPNTSIREAGVGLKGDVSGKVRLLITDISHEGVHIINNTGTTTAGIPFIDVTLEAKKPFDAKLLFSIPEKELDSSNNEKQVPESLNFDYEVVFQKIQ